MKFLSQNKIVIIVSVFIVAALIGYLVPHPIKGNPINPTQQLYNQSSLTITPSLTSTITSTQHISVSPVTNQECSYPSHMCPAGYECYTSVSGGLGPKGRTVQIIDGDQKCHKLCQSDNDCGTTQKCTTVSLQREDYTNKVSICLSRLPSFR